MKRRLGRQTLREKRSLPTSWREVLSGGAWLLMLGVAFVLTIVVSGVAGALLRLIVPWRQIEQPIAVVLGLGFILGAAAGLVRIASGKAVPGTTGRRKIYADIMLVAIGLGGAGFVAFGLTPRSGPGF